VSSDNDHRERIRHYLLQLTGLRSLGDDEPLLTSHVLESLGAIQVVDFIEREFGVQVEDDDLELENFDTLSGLMRLIARKAKAA
jgi:methoxymalonate biosynthesis acyl carrier protein